MAFEIFETGELSEEMTVLWSECFGDCGDYIRNFFKAMPVESVVCGYDEGELVSMTVLICPHCAVRAYYGYAVCTSKKHRGKGYAAQIHEYIADKCLQSGYDYFLHPASQELEGFYSRLGMKVSSSYFEVNTVSYDGVAVRDCDVFEYSFIRDSYFGGYSYIPWDNAALSFMEGEGIRFLFATVDGVDCAAAVDDGMILELCAPEYLAGKAASVFLPNERSVGTVRFITEVNHADRAAVMSLSGKWMYFNLFLD